MIINWHGDTCFSIKSKKAKLIIDPFKDIKGAPTEADMVFVSNEKRELVDLEGEPRIFDWPGEYEMREIPIRTVEVFDKSRSKEDEEGSGNPVNLFKFEIDKVSMCHLGNIGHILKSDMVEELGDIDVLFMPVSESSSLTAKKAHEIVEQIDPRLVILMGDGPFDEFVKEIGTQPREEEEFKIESNTELGEDKTEFVILGKS